MSIADRMSGMTAGKGGGGIAEKVGRHEPEAHAEGGEHTELHAHGDGTYHTVTAGGEKTEHPAIGHALMHMAAHHEPDGKHMHVHHDGMETTSHHVGEDGKVEGPHDHENIEALKEHMGRFLDEEAHEGGDSYGHDREGLM